MYEACDASHSGVDAREEIWTVERLERGAHRTECIDPELDARIHLITCEGADLWRPTCRSAGTLCRPVEQDRHEPRGG
ncbi:MAG: hypothetical protein JWM12_3832 [Ilumatobacteraceae bacterium]|nr:hypothetical protein [Ilumatobacteraceae bacterium]